MTITTLILLLATGIAVTLVHGPSIKNCCNVITTSLLTRNHQQFILLLTCVDKELQYMDIVIASLMEEDG